ncbi:MAG: peptidylprolyl isomerase [Patescibacteria group bacterium]
MDQLEENNKVGENKGKKMFYWGLGVGALVIVLLTVVAFSYRALSQLNMDKTTLFIANALGLPAGFVNGDRVLYSDFAEDVPAVKRFYESQKDKNPEAVVPSEEEIKKSVWDRLVKQAVMEKLADQNNLRVTSKEIDDEYGKFVESVGSAEKATQTVSDSYGWTAEQFKERIIKQFLLQEKVASATSTTKFLDEGIKTKAEQVLAAAREGKQSFEDLAKQYGEDGTKEKGGDLGWFGQGAMIPDFEEAVAKMEPGQISDLVKTQFGYHVIKLVEKKMEKSEQKWRASHILIRSLPFEQYLEALVKKASIWKWIKM